MSKTHKELVRCIDELEAAAKRFTDVANKLDLKLSEADEDRMRYVMAVCIACLGPDTTLIVLAEVSKVANEKNEGKPCPCPIHGSKPSHLKVVKPS